MRSRGRTDNNRVVNFVLHPDGVSALSLPGQLIDVAITDGQSRIRCVASLRVDHPASTVVRWLTARSATLPLKDQEHWNTSGRAG